MNGLFDKETQLDRIEAKLDKLLESKSPKRKRKATFDYPDEFNAVWVSYPKRDGANPKREAFEAFNARIKESENKVKTYNNIYEGVKRYSKHCEANKTAPRFIMQAATFFGPSLHFEHDWKVSAHTIKESLPKSDDDLGAFAVKHGLHKPGCAPQNIVNMGQYREWIKERI